MAHWAFTEYLTVVDPSAALDSALQALSLDPLSLPIMNLVAFSYLGQGMYAEAMQMDEEMLAMDPNFSPAHWNRGIVHLRQGHAGEAIAELTQAVELSGRIPPTLAVLAYAYAKSGDAANALAILAELEGLRGSPTRGYASPVLIAYVYAGLGKTDDAFIWLEQALTDRDGWLVFLNAFPRFESLRDKPRFKDILRQLNLPERDRTSSGKDSG
jgi:adenylate cyclase